MKVNKLHRVIFLGLPLILLVFSDGFKRKRVYGVCEKVLDGDTIIVSGKKIRLWGIDAPEKDQRSLDGIPIGEQSTQYLKSRILGKKVEVKLRGRGKYGRILGEVYLNKNLINYEILADGYGIAYGYSVPKIYMGAEYVAQLKGKGIYGTEGFLRPSYFRRLHKKRGSKKIP